MNRLSLLTLLVGAIALAGCDKKKAAEPIDETAPQTAAQAEEPEEKVELSFALGPVEKAAEMQPDADKLGKLLADETGFDIEVTVPGSHAESIKAMADDEADVVYLSAWAFLKAHMTADASLLVAAVRDGEPGYQSRWYVQKDSGIDKLGNLSGKKIAFTAPTSAAGFLFPYSTLIDEGVVDQGADLDETFAEVHFAGSDEAALEALVSGKIDAAAASDYAFELALSPEEREKLKVLSTQGPVPTQVIAVRADMDRDIRKKLQAALTGLGDADQELVEKVFGTTKLVERSHGDHMMGLQNAQETVGTEYPLKLRARPPREAPGEKKVEDAK